MRLHVEHIDSTVQVFDFKAGLIRMGRSPECEVRFDDGRYPKVSSLHAVIERDADGSTLRALSLSNSTLLNDQPVDQSAAVVAGDKIRLGFTGPVILVVSLSKEDSAPAGTLLVEDTTQILQDLRDLTAFDVSGGGLIGRDTSRANFVLDHPHVSRLHCQIVRSGGELFVKDLGAANATFVNGAPVAGQVRLQEGDSLDIGPFMLQLRGSRLVGQSRRNNVQLVADRVGYEVKAEGQSLQLLKGIELVFNPGEFICILGPSGSGKSTLLRALSGRSSPTAGSVNLNGRNLHQNFAAVKSDLCVIPQTIALHDSLTVEQSLRFAAALRLSPDLENHELDEAVAAVLETVDLPQRKSVRISQLSGGQLKRVGLAGELISGPSLLFIDEVTSGLDEHSDREMMHLFRGLADAGKTLVCVTHNLGHVAQCCTHVVVLTEGGRLAFFGAPTEAIEYFRVARLADIYNRLKAHKREAWQKKYRASGEYQRYIVQRKPAVQNRTSQAAVKRKPVTMTAAIWFRQFATILKRTTSVWMNDKVALATLAGQPVLVAILLCLVFGRFEEIIEDSPLLRTTTTQNFLFLLNVSCFWLGCNTSVKELVKERAIYLQEHQFNLVPEPYFLAKVVFFAAIGVLQALTLGIISFAWYGPPGNGIGLLAVLSLLAVAGMTLGQAISAFSKSEETAIAIVPMVVIPQIILGGVVASLSGFSELLSRVFVTVFWGQHLLTGQLSDAAQAVTAFQPSNVLCTLVIAIQMTVFLFTAWIMIRRLGRR